MSAEHVVRRFSGEQWATELQRLWFVAEDAKMAARAAAFETGGKARMVAKFAAFKAGK